MEIWNKWAGLCDDFSEAVHESMKEYASQSTAHKDERIRAYQYTLEQVIKEFDKTGAICDGMLAEAKQLLSQTNTGKNG